MNSTDKIFRLKGSVQNYAWGGAEFIPNLLGEENTNQEPCAEYWMGAHPRSSATIEMGDGISVSLYEFIQNDISKILGKKVFNQFGELPYLFKILDVKEMLSIQVHPSKSEAVKGFELEEAFGLPIDAPDRNYKDKNHKPEVMIALGDFYLLHGFKKEELLKQVLKDVPEFEPLQKTFEAEGIYGLYKRVMEMPILESDAILKPIIEREIICDHQETNPGFWVKKLYADKRPADNFDKGIFSIYFFNIVHLKKGEGIFQGAGVPHAYLQGQNVELMANSDNVLRGGLTPKHIDVPELLKHTIFEGIEPNVLHGYETTQPGESLFDLPVEDFGISSIYLQPNEEYANHTQSAEIILVMHGQVEVKGKIYGKGDVLFIISDTSYTLLANAQSLLYRAFVPVDAIDM